MKLFPHDYVWGVYFEQALQQLHVTSFLSQWRHAESRRKLPISLHESYWKAYYVGLDVPQIAEFGAKEMVEYADVVLVFSDPNSAEDRWAKGLWLLFESMVYSDRTTSFGGRAEPGSLAAKAL